MTDLIKTKIDVLLTAIATLLVVNAKLANNKETEEGMLNLAKRIADSLREEII